MSAMNIGNEAIRTAVVGTGRTGVSVIRFLLANGMACDAFDESPVTLPDGVHVPLHIGALDGARLQQFDRVIVSPGISWRHPALVQVREAGIPVYGDLQLFGEHFHGDIIAVTGTNGKTTTVSLISTMLDTLPGGIEAGGNIGKPMLELIADGDAPERVVLELSSFQLERAEPIHPRWAVLLNVQPDHADMHVDMQAYRAAKLRLFARQGEGDKATLPGDAEWDDLAAELRGRGAYVRRFGVGSAESLDCGVQMTEQGAWELFWHHFDTVYTIDASQLQTRGRHQHLNLAVAGQAAADFGLSPAVIRQSLTSFRGLQHRLQSLGEVQGRQWFNDSKATNPDAARAALESFEQVIWVCGGLRKGLDVSELKDAVAAHVALMLVTGSDTTAFIELARLAGVKAQTVGSIEQAVAAAAAAPAGLPVLLSPAAASQDQFRDYAERGRCFADAVTALESDA
ncbi:UDP-N-acetylmuramoyl-L-alanine--D-glutamate ligase [Mariprofundus ferrooxydans]|uniref:UDP-N-acetylmuramoyl-L-alanine--D-glutamate ligase n=1 Tax=Mariprofundus ferrooxydans TaxID=314344 RepID=UPI0014304658|nr:UDP-N-acetylmuramoyl-L-alanine--D-glutamate ligase [Mariprofundus ferrooxydans]